MSTEEAPKKRTRRKKTPEPATPDPRLAFLKSLGQWLQSRKYQSNVPVEDIDVGKSFDWMAKAAKLAQAAASLSGMPLLTGGFKYDAAALYDAVVPFFPLGDYVAWRVDGGLNAVVLVIFADEVPATELQARFDQFVTLAEPLAEFGPRIYGSSSASGHVAPLLIYYDPQRYTEHLAQLRAAGSQAKTMQRVYLQAGFVNMAEQSIVWSEKAGLGGWIAGLVGTRGRSPIQFESAELRTVLSLMER